MTKPYFSIVVPVYDEEENLPLLQKEIEAALDPHDKPYEVIYVDDGSQDASYDAMRRLHEARPDVVRLIRLRRNFGQTAALAAGFDAARGEIVVPMDADLQNDPADIYRMVEKLDEGYDVVSGWRVDRKDPLSRRLPSLLANILISRMTGVRLHDYGCTLKVYRREIVEEIQLYGEMHRFLPALAFWRGGRITEMEVNHRPRIHGFAKYGLRRVRHVFLDLITVRFLLSYSTKPMQVFGRYGFSLMFFATLSGLWMILQKIFHNQDITNSAWLYISMFLGLGGLQLTCIGLLGEINVRTYYESQKRTIYTIREIRGLEDSNDAKKAAGDAR